MFESTGHFILRNGAPHLVLTAMPAALRTHYEAISLARGQAEMARLATLETVNADGVDAGAVPASGSAESSGAPTSVRSDVGAPDSHGAQFSHGHWSLPTAAGDVQVEGFLLPLSGLGLHGRRSAQYHANASSERSLEEGAHMVRIGANGEVLGWAITPKALKH